MRIIYLNSEDKELNFESFHQKMIDICNADREKDKALAFAFILYDFNNPQIWKVLNDTQYWFALNNISGNFLTVFSLNYKPPKQRERSPANYSNGFSEFTDISFHKNPSVGTNELIKKYFGNEIRLNYPAILFFQVNKNKVIDSLLIELEEEKIEDSFIELKDYIKKTADLLKNITSENKNNYQEIFDLIEREVNSLRNSKKIKRVKKEAGNIISLISTIKSLF